MSMTIWMLVSRWFVQLKHSWHVWGKSILYTVVVCHYFMYLRACVFYAATSIKGIKTFSLLSLCFDYYSLIRWGNVNCDFPISPNRHNTEKVVYFLLLDRKLRNPSTEDELDKRHRNSFGMLTQVSAVIGTWPKSVFSFWVEIHVIFVFTK